ncbi:hypothetical protein HELRODRAFT_180910 [Helobdella robusta]|uniref:Uncharacterized protein n=1 Tax=Helobdella robusta TaxID=6412 RepID=T1FGE7_HELRO|nr:hypothetical protein HELRODRAFT_180910 [Helobdella robusta]ESN93383.1 hypothetical protein HELRODRAFT_180910 [Helobdella robusta]
MLKPLNAVPKKVFECPFDQKTLNLKITPLSKPSLEASWSEHILANPIKPRQFPHNAIPSTRRSGDVLSQSLTNCQLDRSCKYAAGPMKMSVVTGNNADNLPKSFASFRLNPQQQQQQQVASFNTKSSKNNTTVAAMIASVDKLFEEGEPVNGYAEVLSGGVAADKFSKISETSEDEGSISKTPKQSESTKKCDALDKHKPTNITKQMLSTGVTLTNKPRASSDADHQRLLISSQQQNLSNFVLLDWCY